MCTNISPPNSPWLKWWIPLANVMHAIYQQQPCYCFLGFGNSLFMLLRQLGGTWTCRPLQIMVTSWCDDPHHAPPAYFEDISKCSNSCMSLWLYKWLCTTCLLKKLCPRDTCLWKTSSEECVCPMGVGSRNGWSVHTIGCDMNNNNILVMSRNGRS